MPTGEHSGGQDAAARARRALERGATTLGARAARSIQERWAKLPDARREKLEALVPPRADVSEIEVRDLRDDLTRELDRLSGASIRASRATDRVAGDAPPADSRS
jgi:hypothetical protein